MDKNRRPNSAPIITNEEKNNLERAFKDDDFTPWHLNERRGYKSTYPKELKKLPSKSHSTPSLNSKRIPNTKHNKSSKSYSKTPSDGSKNDNFVFRHHTNTKDYIEEYRTSKLEKMKICLDKTISLQQQTESAFDSNMHHQTQLNITKCIQDIATSSSSSSYTIAEHTQNIYTRHQQQREPRVYSSPVKVRGNKITDWRLNSMKHSPVLPKCEGVVFPIRNTNSNQTFLPEHLLQCKKLNELSLTSKSPDFNNQLNDNWRPRPVRKRGNPKLQQKPPKGMQKETKYSSDYSQLIKRVLEHYDPSQNPVRSQMTKGNALKSNSYLLASTY